MIFVSPSDQAFAAFAEDNTLSTRQVNGGLGLIREKFIYALRGQPRVFIETQEWLWRRDVSANLWVPWY